MQEKEVARQKELIAQDGKHLNVISPCTIGNGIVKLSDPEKAFHIKNFEKNFEKYKLNFFVPASGSGSRMFGFLSSFLLDGYKRSEVERQVHKFLDALTVMPFYSWLQEELNVNDYDLNEESDVKKIISFLIGEKGLNLSSMPKGLVPFHVYEDQEIRTPFEEHIMQNLAVLDGQSKNLNVHFTVQESFKNKIKSVVDALVQKRNLRANITYSTQSKETDAFVFSNGKPLIEDGEYVKRPSGHGALLENIQKIDADIMFLRNIDNIPHQYQGKRAMDTKKILASYLMQKMNEVYTFLSQIDQGEVDDFELKAWIRKNIKISDYPKDPDSFLAYAYELLNRPIRVCGMVKNTGQPGGGPFWVEIDSGKLSKQIVEKAQLNLENKEQRLLFEKSTHFNPVDIACSMKNYKGEQFNLHNFVDEDQVFVVHKTHNGEPVKYIERPGLWNGSMANWMTFFIETSNASFCPVKTVNDLVSPHHLS